jgi:hypothetical protein
MEICSDIKQKTLEHFMVISFAMLNTPLINNLHYFQKIFFLQMGIGKGGRYGKVSNHTKYR